MSNQAPWDEYAAWRQGNVGGKHYAALLNDAQTKTERDKARRKIIKASEHPWENAPHGLLKHLVSTAILRSPRANATSGFRNKNNGASNGKPAIRSTSRRTRSASTSTAIRPTLRASS
jgi:hypothetical protein